MINPDPKMDTHVKKELQQSINEVGLDPEEQAMNDLYGMPETDFENHQNDSQN
ncbi:DUF4021 domain-containing protein [Bacillus cihuensis]|uniref:DUF4021 domain-containing protein n=1 Tax=Bacillus cihuensis TaxID=1208599 RepID=UPI00040F981D|nr:DUF4021 domain-containing protein [Bacillus cihuensis]